MNVFLVLFEDADDLVVQFHFLIPHSLGTRDVPESGGVIFATAGGDPLAAGCPADASDLFLVLLDNVFQFDLIVLARAESALRSLINGGVGLVNRPDEDFGVFADRSQFVTLVVEFAEPHLLFVLSERRRTIGG